MDKKDNLGLVPTFAVHPGSILRSELEERQIKVRDFAKKTKVKYSFLCDFLNGKQHLDEKFADKLDKALGIDSDFWLRVQYRYFDNCAKILLKESSHDFQLHY